MVSFVEGPRILIADRVPQSLVKGLSERGFQVVYAPGIDHRDLAKLARGCDALVVRSSHRIGEEILCPPGRLRLVVRFGTGVDNIDLEAARRAGVDVVNLPDAPVISVAELVVGLMIMCSRDLYNTIHRTKQGLWERPLGRELYGKTLCIVGLGRIGSRVARVASALGMRVVAHDVLDLSSRAEELGAVFVRSLHEMLPQCDYVSLHVPLDSGTRRMFSRREFSMLKRGCVFVNTSRGGVVDPQALLEAVEEGIVSCAAIDTFEREPPEKGSAEEALLRHPRVIATPHIGFQTIEAQERAAEMALMKIERRLRG